MFFPDKNFPAYFSRNLLWGEHDFILWLEHTLATQLDLQRFSFFSGLELPILVPADADRDIKMYSRAASTARGGVPDIQMTTVVPRLVGFHRSSRQSFIIDDGELLGAHVVVTTTRATQFSYYTQSTGKAYGIISNKLDDDGKFRRMVAQFAD